MFETSQLENAVRIGAMEAQATKSTAAAEQRIHAASSVGQYVYFGLHETLLARTPGLYLRRAYIAMLVECNAMLLVDRLVSKVCLIARHRPSTFY